MDSINIDVKMPGLDDSITSVKELRAKINELKDSLVTLDSGTEEYSQTVQELTQYTSKLQEVQSAGKQTVDSLPGSYNELNNQMKELLKQYKSMSVVTDEDKQKQKELAEQINSMNDELKALDAAVGNHQREVGNYANALHGLRDIMDTVHTGTEQLGDGFNAVGSIIGSVTGETSSASSAMEAFGSTFESLTGVAYSLYDSLDKVQIMYEMGSEVMDIFKTKQAASTAATEADSIAKKANTVATAAETTATNAATVATKGLTKALLSNPFTLIAVAVVALIANLDTLVNAFHKVVDWITGANEKLAEEEAATNRVIAANDKLIASQDERSKQFEREIRLMKLNGAGAVAIVKARMKENLANRQALKGQLELTNARIADLKVQAAEDPDKYQKILDAAIKSRSEIVKSYRKLQDQFEDLKITRLEAEKEEREAAKKTATSKVSTSKKANTTIKKDTKDTVKELQDSYKLDVSNFKEAVQSKLESQKMLIDSFTNAKGILKEINDYSDLKTNLSTFGSDLYKVLKTLDDNRLAASQSYIQSVTKSYDEEVESLYKKDNEQITKIKEKFKEGTKEYTRAVEDAKKKTDKAIDELEKKRSELIKENLPKDDLDKLGIINDVGNFITNENYDVIKNANTEITKYANSLSTLSTLYKNGKISEKEYYDSFIKLKEAFNDTKNSFMTDNPEIKNVLLQMFKLGPEDAVNEANEIRSNFLSELLKNLTEDTTELPELNDSPSTGNLILKAFGLDDEGTDKAIEEAQKNIDKISNKLASLTDYKNKYYDELTPEQQQELDQQILDTQAQLFDAQNKQMEDKAKKSVSTIKGIYKGAMSGLSTLGDLFQAKMDLAKTKADKIKKDTSLTEEEQAKLLEEQQKEYNKAFEANKKIQIAQTTISTLQSAMEAYKAMAGIPIVGPALGAAAAAAALATGYMQIKQIKATTPDSLSDSSSSDGSSSVTNTIDVNSLLNSDQESNDLNNDYLTELQGNKQSNTRVYVTESDITNTQNKKKTQVSQSTF